MKKLIPLLIILWLTSCTAFKYEAQQYNNRIDQHQTQSFYKGDRLRHNLMNGPRHERIWHYWFLFPLVIVDL
jgi:hypothetical protein